MNELKQAMEQALEACPFCGEDADEEIEQRSNNLYYVCCTSCMAQIFAKLPAEAVAAWNRRAALRAALSSLPDVQTDEAEFCIEDAGGMFLASTQGLRAEAWREIRHYAAQYSDEGPLTIYEVTRTKVSAASAPKEPQQTDGVKEGAALSKETLYRWHEGVRELMSAAGVESSSLIGEIFRAWEACPPGVALGEVPSKPLNGIGATWTHDEGAYAQCGDCGRYSADPDSLRRHTFGCECGSLTGWSGSFKKPGPDAKWSGSPPGVALPDGGVTDAG